MENNQDIMERIAQLFPDDKDIIKNVIDYRKRLEESKKDPSSGKLNDICNELNKSFAVHKSMKRLFNWETDGHQELFTGLQKSLGITNDGNCFGLVLEDSRLFLSNKPKYLQKKLYLQQPNSTFIKRVTYYQENNSKNMPPEFKSKINSSEVYSKFDDLLLEKLKQSDVIGLSMQCLKDGRGHIISIKKIIIDGKIQYEVYDPNHGYSTELNASELTRKLKELNFLYGHHDSKSLGRQPDITIEDLQGFLQHKKLIIPKDEQKNTFEFKNRKYLGKHILENIHTIKDIEKIFSKMPADEIQILINTKLSNQQHPTNYFSQNKQFDIVDLLLKNGGRVEDLSFFEINDFSELKMLVERYKSYEGFDLDKIANNAYKVKYQQRNTIIYLLQNKNFLALNFLIENGVQINSLEGANDLESLQYVITKAKEKSWNIDKIVNAIFISSDPHSYRYNYPITFFAQQKNSIEILEFLLDNGSKLEFDNHDVTSPNYGKSALLYACRAGNYEAVKYLISKGAKTNYISGYEHPIIEATLDTLGYKGKQIDDSRKSILRLLIENGADITVKITDDEDAESPTPLIHIIRNNTPDVLELLLSYNPDLTRYKSKKLHPLYILLGNEFFIGNLRVLLNHGVDIYEAIEGTTPLQHAATRKNIPGIKLLIKHVLADGKAINVEDIKVDDLHLDGFKSGKVSLELLKGKTLQECNSIITGEPIIPVSLPLKIAKEPQEEVKKQQQEKLEQERLAQEKIQNEILEQQQKEQEKLKQEELKLQKLEQERIAQEILQQKKVQEEEFRQQQERLKQDKLEQERIQEKRLEYEKLEQERLRQEKIQEELIKHKQKEHEGLEQERLEQEALEQKKVTNVKSSPKEEMAIKTEQKRVQKDLNHTTKKKNPNTILGAAMIGAIFGATYFTVLKRTRVGALMSNLGMGLKKQFVIGIAASVLIAALGAAILDRYGNSTPPQSH